MAWYRLLPAPFFIEKIYKHGRQLDRMGKGLHNNTYKKNKEDLYATVVL